jgi:hypothetical protein
MDDPEVYANPAVDGFQSPGMHLQSLPYSSSAQLTKSNRLVFSLHSVQRAKGIRLNEQELYGVM